MQTARAEVFVRALKVSPPAVVLMQLSFTGLHFGLVFNDLCSQSTRLPDCNGLDFLLEPTTPWVSMLPGFQHELQVLRGNMAGRDRRCYTKSEPL